MRIPVYQGEAPEEVTDDDLEVDGEPVSASAPEAVDNVPPIEEDQHGQM